MSSRNSLIVGLRKIFASVKQLIFPLRCPVCDKIVIPYGERICLKCMSKLKMITSPWCVVCGSKLMGEELLCPQCKEGEKHRFTQARALYQYDSAASSVYRFKYGGRKEYGAYFGEEMARYLGEFVRGVEPDGLVPIPLHPKRLRSRGYNQAEILARVLGNSLHIPVYPNYLKRVKNTAPLKNQNPKERQNNLKKAFLVPENDVKLKTIVIIDDIYTTGSTVDEAAGTLLKAGAEKVYVVTLAGGEGF